MPPSDKRCAKHWTTHAQGKIWPCVQAWHVERKYLTIAQEGKYQKELLSRELQHHPTENEYLLT